MAEAPAAAPTERDWRTPRGTKLDDRTAHALIDAIRSGAMLKDAAASAGVSRGTVWRWLDLGAQPDPPEPAAGAKPRERENTVTHWQLCRDLRDAVEKAEADAKIAAVSRIVQAGQEGTWQADAWYLERRYPQEYSRRVVEHQGPGGGPQQHVVEAGPSIADVLADPGRVLLGQEAALGGGVESEQLMRVAATLAAAMERSAAHSAGR